MHTGGMPRSARWGHRAAALVVAVALLTSCAVAAGEGNNAPPTVRLGLFPNITHAPAIAGVERGLFVEALGRDATLETSTFKAGPEAVEALFSGAVDMAYIGANPSITAYTRSGGDAIAVVAGATSGGASLVVRPEIRTAADLRGSVLATPQLGNTQDVALRSWLAGNELEADVQGGGDVSIRPQDNAQTLETFRRGDIDGAWLPEPWATRLVQEGGGKVLVDERTLWPEGEFATTQLVVRKEFLEEHPEVVAGMLAAHVRAVDYVNADPDGAARTVNEAIGDLTGTALPEEVVRAAWSNLTFTVDPIASSLHRSARGAHDAGLIDDDDIGGIHHLSPLNEILKAQGREPVRES